MKVIGEFRKMFREPWETVFYGRLLRITRLMRNNSKPRVDRERMCGSVIEIGLPKTGAQASSLAVCAYN
jgi:hypothetical protein